MRVVVTGAGGFIGGHLADAALAAGHSVLGVDCVTDYYDVAQKRASIDRLSADPGFRFQEADLRTAELAPLLDGAEVIFHLAGQPGVRLSWSDGFVDYVGHNVLATQRLLEAARATRPRRIVYASSSSVYGNAPSYPTTEDDLPRPHSPYGVTKLAGEHLCSLYGANWGVPTVSLRYFTVYGPRQRPDMGMHRFFTAIRQGRPLPIFGDGEQVRDFTFVSDVVAANLAAAAADVAPGTVLNVAGGGSISVNDLIAVIERTVGHEIEIERLPEQAGDVRATGGSIERTRALLGWAPAVGIAEGLAAQWAWQRMVR
jgi:UDP-glucuronate 4-epimerase